jgi:hypothetical protein
MTVRVIPRPGTRSGPCYAWCSHSDCAEARRRAESLCEICGKSIGYGNRYCHAPELLAEGSLVHASCVEESDHAS